MLLDRRLVGDQHPVGALELLEVEDLRVERRRVVDHHQHLGLRIEVRPGTVEQIVQLYATWGRPEKAAEWQTKLAGPVEAESKP